MSGLIVGALIFGTAGLMGVGAFAVDEIITNKKNKKRKTIINEEIKQNRRLSDMEDALDEYPYYDKVYKKGEKTRRHINDLNCILKKEKKIDEEWVKFQNEKIYIVERMIEKSENVENRKEVKKIVLNAIKELKKEIKEKTKEITQQKEKEEKEKFEEKLEQLRN